MDTRKVVINVCFGGFGLSPEAKDKLESLTSFNCWNVPRDNPTLVAIVEEMGKASWGNHSELTIVEIPSDVSWHIHEYDGNEHVAENHRIWR